MLANVILGSERSPAAILSGQAFRCGWQHGRGVTRCDAEVLQGTLVVEYASDRCHAAIGTRALRCQRSAYRLGYTSVQLEDASELRPAPLSLARPIHFVGSLSECAWGRVAELSAIMFPFTVATLLAVRSERLKRRLGFRLAFALLSVPPIWLGLMLLLLSWGYVD